MNDRDLALVKEFAKELKGDIELTFFKGADKRSEDFETFLNEFSELTGISVKFQEGDFYPSLFLKENLEYMAIPSDKELAPFLDEILLLNSEKRKIPSDLKESIGKLEDKVLIDLYISNFCPTCPYTVRQMAKACDYSDKIHLRVIDSMLFTEMTQKAGIMAVPTVVIKDMSWTGEIKFSEILDFILGKSFDKMGSDAMGRMLKDGKASEVAAGLIKNNELYPSFLSLLKDEKWSTRLGAIVVMEEIAEVSRELASKAVPFLFDDFENLNDQIKGDIIYVAGFSGGMDLVPELLKITENTENEELISAAEEAINEIEQHFT